MSVANITSKDERIVQFLLKGSSWITVRILFQYTAMDVSHSSEGTPPVKTSEYVGITARMNIPKGKEAEARTAVIRELEKLRNEIGIEFTEDQIYISPIPIDGQEVDGEEFAELDDDELELMDEDEPSPSR